MDRRNFITKSSAIAAGSIIINPISLTGMNLEKAKKLKVAMVGTGVRGIGMWGKPVVRDYKDIVEFVGLCDINPGRVETGKKKIGVECPTFTNFDEMMKKTKPDLLMVMTVDNTHHEFI